MTQTLDAPAPELTIIEQREPAMPIICTRGGDPDPQEPCGKTATWEGMCLTCGHVFRRCDAHFQEDISDALWDGICGLCATCYQAGRVTMIYLAQYVRIGA